MRNERVTRSSSALEVRLLEISVWATLLTAVLGIAFGLMAQSPAILFDGLFSLIDVAVTWLTIKVAQLVATQGDHRRFQYGFWHLEPLVIALKSSLLMGLVAYAFLNATASLLQGGYEPEFGLALSFGAVITLISFAMWWWLRREGQRIKSTLVELEVKAWLLSALITTAILIAFGAALVMRGTAFEDWIRFVDPLVLALITLVLLPLPWREAREAYGEILLISPPDIDAEVRAAMEAFVHRHGFLDYRSYLSKAGRARFIEISVLVAPDLSLPITAFDALRAEIGEAIGGAGPERWLTITFTANPALL